MTTHSTVTLNDGTIMPQIGLGVWKASEEEAYEAVSEALRTGYRLIDTATAYGNEAAVGRAVRESGIPREEIFVTTKLWNSDQGYDEALVAFDKSLDKLGLDYLDLYLIHWPMPEVGTYLDSWRALEEIKASGRVKSIGVSNFNANHLEKVIANAGEVPAVNQIEIHPDFQQVELRQFCHERGIAIESWSPIGQGGELLQHPTLTSIAERHEKTPAQIVIRWHIQSGLIVIPKSVHAERIRENFDVFDFELSEADMHEIRDMDSGNRLGPDPLTMNG